MIRNSLIFVALLAPVFAQPPAIIPFRQPSTVVVQKWFGYGPPTAAMTYIASQPGDHYVDLTNLNEYWCAAQIVTFNTLPACTSVTAGGWVEEGAGSAALLVNTTPVTGGTNGYLLGVGAGPVLTQNSLAGWGIPTGFNSLTGIPYSTAGVISSATFGELATQMLSGTCNSSTVVGGNGACVVAAGLGANAFVGTQTMSQLGVGPSNTSLGTVTASILDRTATTGATLFAIGEDVNGHTSATTTRLVIEQGTSQGTTHLLDFLNSSGSSLGTYIDQAGNFFTNTGNFQVSNSAVLLLYCNTNDNCQVGGTGTIGGLQPRMDGMVTLGSAPTGGFNGGFSNLFLYTTASVEFNADSNISRISAGVLGVGTGAQGSTAGTWEGHFAAADGTVGVTVTTCTGFKNGLCISGT